MTLDFAAPFARVDYLQVRATSYDQPLASPDATKCIGAILVWRWSHFVLLSFRWTLCRLQPIRCRGECASQCIWGYLAHKKQSSS